MGGAGGERGGGDGLKKSAAGRHDIFTPNDERLLD
jgi:hypothetical protein